LIADENKGNNEIVPEESASSNDQGAISAGAALVAKLEAWSVEELRARLESVNLETTGSKSELVVRLTLWTHKSTEAQEGRLNLEELSRAELNNLSRSLGMAESDSSSKESLVKDLRKCFQLS